MLRVFHHYISGRKVAFFAVESSAIALLGAAGALGAVWALGPPEGAFSPGQLVPLVAGVWLVVVATFQFALYLLDLYNLRVAGLDRYRGSRVLRALGSAVSVTGLLGLWLGPRLPMGAVLGGVSGAALGALLVRTAFQRVLGGPARVLIVGSGERARLLSRALEDEGEDSFRVLPLVDPSRFGEGKEDLGQLAQAEQVRYVIGACEEAEGIIGEQLLRARLAGLEVHDDVGFSEQVLRRLPLSSLKASALAYGCVLKRSWGRRVLTRLFDLLAALALLFFSWPLMVLIALAVKLGSKGPILYRQERIGQDGRIFMLWKFRSMRVDAEKDGVAVWARQNDDRVTPVGRILRKSRGDELPQIFCVLRGQMSFVGPRPERPIFVSELKRLIPFYGLRELVKPGLTGWAQLRYPYGASVEDARNKLEYDLYYIKNGSLFLDLACLFHTVRHVLVGRGAR